VERTAVLRHSIHSGWDLLASFSGFIIIKFKNQNVTSISEAWFFVHMYHLMLNETGATLETEKRGQTQGAVSRFSFWEDHISQRALTGR
jgi:hypothetical protein